VVILISGDLKANDKRASIGLKRAGESDLRLEDFRWRTEELRVSLYAQELKTPYPVSYRRLDKLWSEITR
jgi:hypothetical protein